MKRKLKIFSTFLLIFLSVCSVDAKTLTLHENNTVVMSTGIDTKTTPLWLAKIRSLDQNRTNKNIPLYVLLSCPGGDLIGLKELEAAIVPIKNIHSVIVYAASACTMLSQSIPGTRYITDNAHMMHHLTQIFIRGGFYNQQDVNDIYQVLVSDVDLYVNSIKRSNMPFTSFMSRILKGDWKIGTKEILELKFADELVDLECKTKSKKLELFKYQNCLTIGDN